MSPVDWTIMWRKPACAQNVPPALPNRAPPTAELCGVPIAGPSVSKMWSAFEPTGILLPTRESSTSNGTVPQPDVFQMMWSNAFSTLVRPDPISTGAEQNEAVLQKHLCATSLLQQALSVLSNRHPSELTSNQIPTRSTAEGESGGTSPPSFQNLPCEAIQRPNDALIVPYNWFIIKEESVSHGFMYSNPTGA
ncbi:hypothetical protein Aperf_G00000048336 [Anoplocephala perfoliata]